MADAMTTDAAREAGRRTASDRFIEHLAEMTGGHASIQAVFGAPIERGDLTIVPVARVRWAFGGGSGSFGEAGGALEGQGSGAGGGGGVTADPIGYIEIDHEGAAFRPIADALPSPLFLLAAGLTAALVLRSLGAIVGSLRR
ncbi:MAG TPA: spore germination protein GerW family protein [Candidatus Limnocylindrales bacterium]